VAIKGEVLVIDDDADLCDALESALQEDGFAVRCANQGTRGLGLMREKKPDLVFLDVMMRMPTFAAPFLRALAPCSRLE
jgi:DNA-binding response OmpR family regulator